MSGKDSRLKSRIPSSPPSVTAVAEVLAAEAPSVSPSPAPPASDVSVPSQASQDPAPVNAAKSAPILSGLFGILLVGAGALGGWYLFTHPNSQPTARTNPAQPQVSVNPAPVNPAQVNPEPVNPAPAPDSQLAATPPLPTPEKAVTKRTTPEAKTAPKANGKETTAKVTAETNPPAPSPTPARQPVSDAKGPTPAPQPAAENTEEHDQVPVTRQPALTVAVTVKDGLPFSMVLADDVPADTHEGLPLHFVIASNVQVDDMTIIAQGATVTASVVPAKKKILGFGGGKVSYQLRNVQSVDGKQLKVRAVSSHSGDGTSTHPFETPKDPQKKEFAARHGAEYVGYIDTDQTVSVRK
jgi:hypothetical protein